MMMRSDGVVWYKIVGFDNYGIDKYGNVRNFETGNQVKHQISTGGVQYVLLSRRNKRYKFMISRLLEEACMPFDTLMYEEKV